MKAVLAEKYGGPDVLKIQEVAKLSPKDNEVLIRINSTVAAFRIVRSEKEGLIFPGFSPGF